MANRIRVGKILKSPSIIVPPSPKTETCLNRLVAGLDEDLVYGDVRGLH